MSPRDATAAAMESYRTWSGPRQPRHRTAELAALASAQVFLEALQRAGAEVTRDTLLDAIDSLADFATGFVPPLTYTPTRHLGSTGAYIVNINDPRGEALTWVDAAS
jgi:hypothetical protein